MRANRQPSCTARDRRCVRLRLCTRLSDSPHARRTQLILYALFAATAVSIQIHQVIYMLSYRMALTTVVVDYYCILRVVYSWFLSIYNSLSRPSLIIKVRLPCIYL